jgi:hypothetical protein
MPSPVRTTWVISACLIFSSLTSEARPDRKAQKYPEIKGVNHKMVLGATSPEAEAKVIIKDSLGRPAYELVVIAISSDSRTTDSIHLRLITLGDYAHGPAEKYEPNLLNPDYWGHGRGLWIIEPEDLCPDAPGSDKKHLRRRFSLRRMQIAVELEEAELSANFCPQEKCGSRVGGISKAQVKVSVTPGASKRSRPRTVKGVRASTCV